MALLDDLAGTGLEYPTGCPLCGKQEIPADRLAELLALQKPYGARTCLWCGLRWLAHRPDAAGRAVLASERYAEGKVVPTEALRTRTLQIAAYGARSVLDFGASGLAGIEGRMTVDAATHPEEVTGRYDAIHMHHVLQRMPDPLAHMKWCRRHMLPGSVLWVEVPYRFDSLPARWRRFTGRWQPSFSADSLRDLFFFDKKTLRKLCDLTGFEVAELRQQGDALMLRALFSPGH